MYYQCPHCYYEPVETGSETVQRCPACDFPLLIPELGDRRKPRHRKTDPALPLKQLGPYQLIEVLEHTPHGTRYKGFRTGTLPEDRAYVSVLALPRLFSQDADLIASLEKQFAAARQLDHPGFVKFIDCGAEHNIWYAVCEFYLGTPLREVLKAPTPLEKRVALGHTIARAIAYAHANGVILGLLTPDHVILDTQQRCRVTEFGLSRLLLEHPLTETVLPARQFWQSCFFQAPEQRQFSQPPSRGGDLYSLGAVLYEMISGKPPAGVIDSLRRLEPSIPEALDELVLGLMRPDPGNRQTSAERVVQQLSRLDWVFPEQLPETHRSVRKPPKESSSGLKVSTIVVLLLVGALAFAGYEFVLNRPVGDSSVELDKKASPRVENVLQEDVQTPDPVDKTPPQKSPPPKVSKKPPLRLPKLTPLVSNLFPEQTGTKKRKRSKQKVKK